VIRLTTILLGAVLAGSSAPTFAQANPATKAVQRDGQKDFDWEIGTWSTKVRVLQNPLSGEAPKWAEFEGTSVVKPLLDGRANFVELSVASSGGKIEGGSLRLYNPQSLQWSLNYASLRNGVLTAPVYGGFDASGRGAFYGQDTIDGRVVFVRFIITRPSDKEARFEQAYSADGGVNWETNWFAVDIRR
jgi:hypothetical protein